MKVFCFFGASFICVKALVRVKSICLFGVLVTSSIYFSSSSSYLFFIGLGTRILIDVDTCYIDLLFKYILSTNYSSILSTTFLYTSNSHPSPTNKKEKYFHFPIHQTRLSNHKGISPLFITYMIILLLSHHLQNRS